MSLFGFVFNEFNIVLQPFTFYHARMKENGKKKEFYLLHYSCNAWDPGSEAIDQQV